MLAYLAIGSLVLIGVALRLERRRTDRLGLDRSQHAGIDPVTGLYDGDAAVECMRLQLLTANRLGRDIHLARTTKDAEARALRLAPDLPPGSMAVRPTSDSLVVSSFRPLSEMVAGDAWDVREVPAREAQELAHDVLAWVAGGEST